METLGGFRCFAIFSLLCAILPWCHGNFVPRDFEEKLTALLKVLEYIRHRPEQMNADVTFSVTIVQANIAATILHENVQDLAPAHRNLLKLVLILTDATRRHLMSTVVPENENVRLLHESLNNPVPWSRKIRWRRGVLRKGSPAPGLTYREVRDLIMQGTPKEEESDRCLAEIVRNTFNFDPRFPRICNEILMTQNPARGYPLTHRLLILQVARTMKCDQEAPFSFPDLINSCCSAILRDLIDIEAAGFPYDTPDLMMEQVLLCGMEGFLEFTGEHYEKLVLKWPHPSGCYSSFGNKFPNGEINVVRRSSSQTDYGCDSHATGLAAASLSLFIRENVENAFSG